MTAIEVLACTCVVLALDFCIYQSRRTRGMTDEEFIRYYYFRLMNDSCLYLDKIEKIIEKIQPSQVKTLWRNTKIGKKFLRN